MNVLNPLEVAVSPGHRHHLSIPKECAIPFDKQFGATPGCRGSQPAPSEPPQLQDAVP
jgi:hypothetical protein